MEEKLGFETSNETGACPSETLWIELAAGHRTGTEADALLAHAAECRKCAQSLREALALFPEENENQLTASTISSVEPDPRQLAEKMAALHRRPAGRGSWFQWGSIAAALALMAVSAWFLVRPNAQPPLAQLASVYEIRRSFELRLSGAGFSPVISFERGITATDSAGLLELRAAIRRHLDRNPGDPGYLHAQGRAALLDWRYEEAITSLRSAADAGLDLPDLWIDLGTAYYQRAVQSREPVDYSRAIEQLSRALKLRPGDAVALYNRGIVHAKLFLHDAAIQDFEACLKAEGDAAWRRDIELRLEEERRKRAVILAPPSPGVAELQLEAALSGELRAPSGLAAQLLREHRDRWLGEALATARRADIGEAVRTLSVLARIRSGMTMGAYASHGSRIDALARQPLPEPLAIWRDFELLFRATHGLQAARCPGADSLYAHASARSYRWFQVQILLEDSSCQSSQNRLDAAHHRTLEAIRIAGESGWRVALARARGFHASHAINEGRYREAFRLDWANLEQLHEGGYPPARAAQPYGNIVRAAEQLERWSTAQAGAAMVAATAGAAQWDYTVMAAQSRRAQYAARAGDPAVGQYFGAALAAISSLPQNSDSGLYQSAARIGLYRSMGDLGGLEKLLASLRLGENPFVDLPLLNALGALRLQRGDALAAEADGQRVLELAQSRPSAFAHTWRREIDEAAQLSAEARLRRGQHQRALAGWREYLVYQRRLLAGREPAAPTPQGKDDTAVITVAPLNGRVAIWTSQRDTHFRWSSVSYATLLANSRRLRWLCARRETSLASVYAAAEAVRKELILGVTGQPQRLIFELNGELANLPWLLLAAGAAEEVYVAPHGFSNLLWTTPTAVFTVEANHVHAQWRAELPPLPELGAEAETIARVFPGSISVSGKDATVARLRNGLKASEVFHFAGHTIRQRGRPVFVVAPDEHASEEQERLGLWDGSPAGGTKLRCRLAVFSACSTADYVETDSVEPGQLAEGALVRGAQYAVASLWNVDSAATSRLMRTFYKELGAGRSPGGALQAASQAIRATAGFEHPYYWAAFAVYQSNLGVSGI